jgi:hypothetical protein
VTRGTRPKKPSSSGGFVHEACGIWGFWGLKTENRKLKKIEKPATSTKRNFLFLNFLNFSRPRGRVVASTRTRTTSGNFPPKSSFMASLPRTTVNSMLYQ